MAATSACVTQLGLYAPHCNDRLFSFLPLAHTMQRCCELAVYMAGGAVRNTLVSRNVRGNEFGISGVDCRVDPNFH